jgi:hypothetical protein
MCNRDRRRNILETKREWQTGWLGFAHCDEPDSNGESQRIFVHFSDIKSGGFRYLTLRGGERSVKKLSIPRKNTIHQP